jgi:hypothetical protein
MEKDSFDVVNSHIKSNDEVLEISSTGYGLESVEKKNLEKQNVQDLDNTNSPGCGGL